MKQETGMEPKFLKVRMVVWKPNVVTQLFGTFPGTQAIKAANFWQFLVFSKTIWITSPTPELVALICTDVEGPIHGPLAKINSSYQNKYAQKLLVMQKLKKNSLNKKSNCLLGEAMRVKVLSCIFCAISRNTYNTCRRWNSKIRLRRGPHVNFQKQRPV